MWEIFKKASDKQLSEAEQALKSWRIEYSKQPDGSILIPGDLDISDKGLTKLPNLSYVKVVGGFYCRNNQLTSLEGAPHAVGDSFDCSTNQLTSLEGGPHTVGGGFFCYSNQLTSLKHAPHTVSGDFFCSYNQLTSLEGAPQKFEMLYSDFGTFAAWDTVPEQFRLSPATKAQQEKERERQEEERQIAFSEGATVLNDSIKVSSPLRLKK
jgi:hypothetical protein